MHQDGVIYLSIFLFIFSGIFALFFDSGIYKRDQLKTEQKLVRVLGWIHIAIGGTILVGNWCYNAWFYYFLI
ncbi:CLC_0170 family protein [Halalkalibacter krulwichiae]|uniref:Uncharacterized protein n=1 Tax=Halalkalibacter krulwichiae TaxID=199441 RepID=A0A1X9MBY2_9BACI|nr:CLC_0170 family protein [Halalkalibacter krulwichiae]ARK30927.1 hypothetical protein BkAM31D_14370 [Halalkalibacter krulwichiae]